ncbi:MAG: ATP synthase F0 subunit B [Clostridiales bacterium]|jgi:F-type H+-transporting ATPase subunit b|nr:ATP synthase F0 subunit B [Clostridiales bacterium]
MNTGLIILAAEEGGSLLENLGLDNPLELLFYAVNLIILVGGLYLLLFKPVKKLITKRKETLAAVYNENEKLNKEALELKHKYEEAIATTCREAAESAFGVTKAAEGRADEIIAAAKQKADDIIEAAEAEAVAERKRLSNDFKHQIMDLAIEVAGTILEREVSSEDNDKIIEEALGRWKN